MTNINGKNARFVFYTQNICMLFIALSYTMKKILKTFYYNIFQVQA